MEALVIVQLMGHDLTKMNEEERAKLHCTTCRICFSIFYANSNVKCLRECATSCVIKGESEKQSHTRAVDLLKQLGLGERLYHMPAQLSGGEQQRVALARAFCTSTGDPVC